MSRPKVRLNIYLSPEMANAFKRCCKSRKISYSSVLERLIYRFLATSKSGNKPNKDIVEQQERTRIKAHQAMKQVYCDAKQELIDTVVDSIDTNDIKSISSVKQSIVDDTKSIPFPRQSKPIPMPKTSVTQPQNTGRTEERSSREIRTNHLSKHHTDRPDSGSLPPNA